MKKIWITYSWLDNDNKDVDFIKQELESRGYDVHLDKFVLIPGKRHWEKIGESITKTCDAWVFFATQNSLTSEPCKEEYAYALNRALSQEGSKFPVITLFSSSIEKELIPAGIQVRIYTSLEDPDWLDIVCSGIESHPPRKNDQYIEPFFWDIHTIGSEDSPIYVLEVRPRGGSWVNPFVMVPQSERITLGWDEFAEIFVNNSGAVPSSSVRHNYSPFTTTSENIDFFGASLGDVATPTKSLYAFFRSIPNGKVIFGALDKSRKNTYYILPKECLSPPLP